MKIYKNTFNDYKYNKIICSIDYFKKHSSQCRIYSYLYKLKFYNSITNNFSGELFKCVRQISLFDEKPFEHDFFFRIEKSFPFLENISIHYFQPQNNKSSTESNKDNQYLSIVKYPYLNNLSLINVHDYYFEQFLVYTKVSLPNNVHLNISYEPLKRVTNNFTRNVTQINGRKLQSLRVNVNELSKHVQDYFLHTEIICL
ncbi:unnamed protein product [Rotaria sp. Silwood2]|nr:unnamed protein product [Rotaria sp. Silwood2]